MELSRASFAESSPIFLSSSFSARLRSPTNVPYDSGREYMRSITRIVIRKCKLLRNGKTFCEGAEYETLYSTESNETRPPSNLRLSNVGSDPIRNGTPPLRERRIDLQGFTKLAILRSSLSPQSRPSFFFTPRDLASTSYCCTVSAAARHYCTSSSPRHLVNSNQHLSSLNDKGDKDFETFQIIRVNASACFNFSTHRHFEQITTSTSTIYTFWYVMALFLPFERGCRQRWNR